MNNKTLSIVSYITIIGWIIAFFGSQGNKREGLLTYHLKQSLGLAIVSVVFAILISIVSGIVSGLAILGYANIIFLILWIIGIISAANEKQEPLPVIGKIFEDKFSFIQ